MALDPTGPKLGVTKVEDETSATSTDLGPVAMLVMATVVGVASALSTSVTIGPITQVMSAVIGVANAVRPRADYHRVRTVTVGTATRLTPITYWIARPVSGGVTTVSTVADYTRLVARTVGLHDTRVLAPIQPLVATVGSHDTRRLATTVVTTVRAGIHDAVSAASAAAVPPEADLSVTKVEDETSGGITSFAAGVAVVALAAVAGVAGKLVTSIVGGRSFSRTPSAVAGVAPAISPIARWIARPVSGGHVTATTAADYARSFAQVIGPRDALVVGPIQTLAAPLGGHETTATRSEYHRLRTAAVGTTGAVTPIHGLIIAAVAGVTHSIPRRVTLARTALVGTLDEFPQGLTRSMAAVTGIAHATRERASYHRTFASTVGTVAASTRGIQRAVTAIAGTIAAQHNIPIIPFAPTVGGKAAATTTSEYARAFVATIGADRVVTPTPMFVAALNRTLGTIDTPATVTDYTRAITALPSSRAAGTVTPIRRVARMAIIGGVSAVSSVSEYHRTITAVTGTVASVIATFGEFVVISVTVGAARTLSPAADYARAFAAVGSTSEAVTPTPIFHRALTSVVGVAVTLPTAATYHRVLTRPVSAIETATRVPTYLRALNPAVGVAPPSATVADYTRSVAPLLSSRATAMVTPLFHVARRSVLGGVTATPRRSEYFRSFTAVTGVATTLIATLGEFVALSATVAASRDLTPSADYVRSFTAVESVRDTVTPTPIVHRALSAVSGLRETAATVTDYHRALTAPVGVVPAPITTPTFLRAITTTVGAVVTRALTGDFRVAMAPVVGTHVVFNTPQSTKETLSTVIGVSESVSRRATFHVAIGEVLDVHETVAASLVKISQSLAVVVGTAPAIMPIKRATRSITAIGGMASARRLGTTLSRTVPVGIASSVGKRIDRPLTATVGTIPIRRGLVTHSFAATQAVIDTVRTQFDGRVAIETVVGVTKAVTPTHIHVTTLAVPIGMVPTRAATVTAQRVLIATSGSIDAIQRAVTAPLVGAVGLAGRVSTQSDYRLAVAAVVGVSPAVTPTRIRQVIPTVITGTDVTFDRIGTLTRPFVVTTGAAVSGVIERNVSTLGLTVAIGTAPVFARTPTFQQLASATGAIAETSQSVADHVRSFVAAVGIAPGLATTSDYRRVRTAVTGVATAAAPQKIIGRIVTAAVGVSARGRTTTDYARTLLTTAGEQTAFDTSYLFFWTPEVVAGTIATGRRTPIFLRVASAASAVAKTAQPTADYVQSVVSTVGGRPAVATATVYHRVHPVVSGVATAVARQKIIGRILDSVVGVATSRTDTTEYVRTLLTTTGSQPGFDTSFLFFRTPTAVVGATTAFRRTPIWIGRVIMATTPRLDPTATYIRRLNTTVGPVETVQALRVLVVSAVTGVTETAATVGDFTRTLRTTAGTYPIETLAVTRLMTATIGQIGRLRPIVNKVLRARFVPVTSLATPARFVHTHVANQYVGVRSQVRPIDLLPQVIEAVVGQADRTTLGPGLVRATIAGTVTTVTRRLSLQRAVTTDVRSALARRTTTERRATIAAVDATNRFFIVHQRLSAGIGTVTAVTTVWTGGRIIRQAVGVAPVISPMQGIVQRATAGLAHAPATTTTIGQRLVATIGAISTVATPFVSNYIVQPLDATLGPATTRAIGVTRPLGADTGITGALAATKTYGRIVAATAAITTSTVRIRTRHITRNQYVGPVAATTLGPQLHRAARSAINATPAARITVLGQVIRETVAPTAVVTPTVVVQHTVRIAEGIVAVTARPTLAVTRVQAVTVGSTAAAVRDSVAGLILAETSAAIDAIARTRTRVHVCIQYVGIRAQAQAVGVFPRTITAIVGSTTATARLVVLARVQPVAVSPALARRVIIGRVHTIATTDAIARWFRLRHVIAETAGIATARTWLLSRANAARSGVRVARSLRPTTRLDAHVGEQVALARQVTVLRAVTVAVPASIARAVKAVRAAVAATVPALTPDHRLVQRLVAVAGSAATAVWMPVWLPAVTAGSTTQVTRATVIHRAVTAGPTAAVTATRTVFRRLRVTVALGRQVTRNRTRIVARNQYVGPSAAPALLVSIPQAARQGVPTAVAQVKTFGIPLSQPVAAAAAFDRIGDLVRRFTETAATTARGAPDAIAVVAVTAAVGVPVTRRLAPRLQRAHAVAARPRLPRRLTRPVTVAVAAVSTRSVGVAAVMQTTAGGVLAVRFGVTKAVSETVGLIERIVEQLNPTDVRLSVVGVNVLDVLGLRWKNRVDILRPRNTAEILPESERHVSNDVTVADRSNDAEVLNSNEPD